MKKPKTVYAFAAVNPSDGRINPWWVRAMAKDVRGDAHLWKTLRKKGWRCIRVKIVPARPTPAAEGG